jgi:hypothetical protein
MRVERGDVEAWCDRRAERKRRMVGIQITFVTQSRYRAVQFGMDGQKERVDGREVQNWGKYFHLVLDAPTEERRTCIGEGWLKGD